MVDVAQVPPTPGPAIPPPQDLLTPTTPSFPSPPPLRQPAPVEPVPLQVPPAQPSQTLPGTVPGTIVVQRFEVQGSTIFKAEDFATVTAAFTNRPISFAELLQVRSAITQFYTDRGYVTTGAIIPPQTLESGVVIIQVVEGSLEAITVTGTRRLSPNYVKSRLAIAARAPLNSRRLLEALQLLQLDPLIQSVSAELSAGINPGTNVLEVKVTEAQTLRAQIALDNGRPPSVGSFRRRIQATELNLSGLGDSLSLGYTNTKGSHAIDGSYTFPINPRNGTISIGVGVADNRIIEEPFDEIDIEAKSRNIDLTFRQPLIQSPTQEFALGITASRQESETTLLNEPFPLSPGADDQGRTRVSALRFFQDWTRRNARSVLAFRSQFSLGLGVLNATVNAQAPDSRFFSWRLQSEWVRLLAPDTLLLLRSDLQLSNRSLLPVEEFSIGGLDNVRGYRQDALLGDNGAFASVELRVPILRVPQWQAQLQLTPFIDFGKTWASSGKPNPSTNTLVSAGFGLRWQQSERLTARLEWGIPLISVDSEKRTLQENGIYFSLVYNLF